MKRIQISKVKPGDSIQLIEGQKMRKVEKVVNINRCNLMVTFDDGFWIKLDVNKMVELAE